MSDTTPEQVPVNDTPSQDVNPPAAQVPDDFFDRLTGYLETREKNLEARLRSQLVHSTSTPEPEPEEEPGPKDDGGYCNQCPATSADKETAEEPDANPLLWAIDHNATHGHHVTVWDAERPYQVAPRAS